MTPLVTPGSTWYGNGTEERLDGSPPAPHSRKTYQVKNTQGRRPKTVGTQTIAPSGQHSTHTCRSLFSQPPGEPPSSLLYPQTYTILKNTAFIWRCGLFLSLSILRRNTHPQRRRARKKSKTPSCDTTTAAAAAAPLKEGVSCTQPTVLANFKSSRHARRCHRPNPLLAPSLSRYKTHAFSLVNR